jgi:hypothetical protein
MNICATVRRVAREPAQLAYHQLCPLDQAPLHAQGRINHIVDDHVARHSTASHHRTARQARHVSTVAIIIGMGAILGTGITWIKRKSRGRPERSRSSAEYRTTVPAPD